MARDLYNIYAKRNGLELRKLRSKHYNRLMYLESRRMGWFDLREADSLRHRIITIDAELEARRLQQPMEIE